MRWMVVCAVHVLLWGSMQAEIKAVIFDCDGVLVDSEEMKFQAWERVLQKRGIAFSADYYQTLIGGSNLLRQIEHHYGCVFDPEITKEKQDAYLALQASGVKPIAQILPVVEFVQAARKRTGLLVGVASSSGRREILCNLDELFMTDALDAIVSGKEDLKQYGNPGEVNKPQPYIYQEISRQLKVEPCECLVLEDSEPGVLAAKRAGCKVIAVPTLWTEKQDFSMADLIIYPATTEEILKAIKLQIH